VRIVAFESHHAAWFKAMNLQWLKAFDLLEPADVAELTDPHGSFVAVGGAIYIAEEGSEVVGACALRPWIGDAHEIAKLVVAPSARGRGYGKRLVQKCIQVARRKGARRIVLVSNSRLTRALNLYHALGFSKQPVPPELSKKYVTADVFMSLDLSEDVAGSRGRRVNTDRGCHNR
jgi:putative acetyltransferase